TNYATDVTEVKEASDGYESVPAVVSMADVYVEKHGFFWNDEARLSAYSLVHLGACVLYRPRTWLLVE
ncbi:unnamed protein product, partial [Ectocarpus sp. 12 AP-2014]